MGGGRADGTFDAYETPDTTNVRATTQSVAAMPELQMSDLAATATTYTFQNLCCRVKTASGPKEVLVGVSGSLPVGSLSALIGPSGAGKSSLFDVLLGVQDGELHSGSLPLQEKVVYISQVRRRRLLWPALRSRAVGRRLLVDP